MENKWKDAIMEEVKEETKKVDKEQNLVTKVQHRFDLNKKFYHDNGDLHPNKEVQQTIIDMLNIYYILTRSFQKL